VYVSSSELIRQRYKSGLVNVGMPEYSYDVYLWIILAVVAVYVAKKLLLRRREKPPKGTTPEKQASKKKYAKSRWESGMRELVELIRKDLGKGTPEKELMSMLISSGLKEEDVQAAFKQARKKG
jgi:protein involved in sex pheromone biosynthesis